MCIPYHTGSGEIVCLNCGKPMGGNPHAEAENISGNCDHNHHFDIFSNGIQQRVAAVSKDRKRRAACGNASKKECAYITETGRQAMGIQSWQALI